jgi:hypothetical protein
MAYLDGFNLFYGLRDSGWRRYYWLNPSALVSNLLRPGQQLMGVRYFTARITPSTADPGKHLRQQTYLEAIGTLGDTRIVYGHYLAKTKQCRACGASWQQAEEKMTDVNIAVSLLADALDDLYDLAFVISADSDLVPPVLTLRTRFPAKRVIVVSPPRRHSVMLANAAHVCFTIGRKKLQDSQFPDRVVKADGYVLHRPASWT